MASFELNDNIQNQNSTFTAGKINFIDIFISAR